MDTGINKIHLLFLVTSFLGNLLDFAGSQSLQATLSSARFPQAITTSSATYDGDDNIYVRWSSQIYQFSISNDSIQQVAELPVDGSGHPTILRGNGSILLFAPLNLIYNLNTLTHEISDFARTPILATSGFSSTVINSTHAVGIGGWYGGSSSYFPVLYLFSLDNGQTLRSSPLDIELEVYQNPFVVYDGSGTVIVFYRVQGFWIFYTEVLYYDIATGTSRRERLGEGALTYDPTVVHDGSSSWIVSGLGGYSSNQPSNGVYRLANGNETLEFVPVSNYPASRYNDYFGVSAAYVQKLNRIYTFGGNSDEIWYIDL